MSNFNISDIGKRDSTEELAPLFKKLHEVKEQLGGDVWQEIRMRLVDGHLARQEANYLQGQRRDVATSYLGMDRDNYENMLDGKPHKADKKIDDRKTLKKFLHLG